MTIQLKNKAKLKQYEFSAELGSLNSNTENSYLTVVAKIPIKGNEIEIVALASLFRVSTSRVWIVIEAME